MPKSILLTKMNSDTFHLVSVGSAGVDFTQEMLIAHFPISSNVERSSNKYQFFNSLLLPKTHSPYLLPKIQEKETTGLGTMLWRLNFMSLVILFEEKSMEMLAYQEKTKNIPKSAGCSNPSCHRLAVGLLHNCRMERNLPGGLGRTSCPGTMLL